jgi:hypothetical protein
MACRGAPSFEEFIKKRLGPRSEASKMITSLSKDTSISNAVAMTIEALSASQSRDLRHLVDSFQRYCDWVEDWEPRGWEIEAGDWITLLGPPGREWADLCARGAHPSDDVVAAAAGVSAVKFDDVVFDKRIEITFRVTR